MPRPKYWRDFDMMCGDACAVDPRVQPLARELTASFRCVTEHLWFHFKRQPSNGIAKTLVELEPLDARITEQVDVLGDVAIIRRNFDFERYSRASNVEKKRIALEALCDGLIAGANSLGLQREPIVTARDTVLAENLELRRFAGRPIWNPSRQHKCQNYYEYDVDWVELFVVVVTKNGQILLKEKLEEWAAGWSEHGFKFAELSWINDHRIRCKSRMFDREFEINAKTDGMT